MKSHENEIDERVEYRRACGESRESGPRFVPCFVGETARALLAVSLGVGRFPPGSVGAGRLSRSRRVAGHVEKVVDDLERKAEGAAVLGERMDHVMWCARGDRP